MELIEHIKNKIVAAGGWIGFADFMHEALYAPNMGYYSAGKAKLGLWPQDGSDFVTAPELSDLFGKTLASQLAQALSETGTTEIWEFGAGSGALAEQILGELGGAVTRYHIVEVSANLQARQRERLAQFADKVLWQQGLPPSLRGVVVGNEVLDAMPVTLLCRKASVWYERGVALAQPDLVKNAEQAHAPSAMQQQGRHSETTVQDFCFVDKPTELRPPVDIEEGGADYLTELHLQAQAFTCSVAEALVRGGAGALFLIDYGFPEHEYYHPQRSMGTLMCHHAHQNDDNPLLQVGQKDITTHIDFTAIVSVAEQAGLELLGYTSQAHFLLNCGLAQRMQTSNLAARSRAQKLIQEHEMGELFKVVGFATHDFEALGFTHADRSHRL